MKHKTGLLLIWIPILMSCCAAFQLGTRTDDLLAFGVVALLSILAWFGAIQIIPLMEED